MRVPATVEEIDDAIAAEPDGPAEYLEILMGNLAVVCVRHVKDQVASAYFDRALRLLSAAKKRMR